MEKSYSFYEKCINLINSKIPISKVYIYMDECMSIPFQAGSFVNAAQHVYGYVKDRATEKEKESFNILLRSPMENRDKIKIHLKKLCKKYDVKYMNKSYYFIL